MLARRLDTYYGVDYVVGVPEAEVHIRALRGKGRPFSQDSHERRRLCLKSSCFIHVNHYCLMCNLKRVLNFNCSSCLKVWALIVDLRCKPVLKPYMN